MSVSGAVRSFVLERVWTVSVRLREGDMVRVR